MCPWYDTGRTMYDGCVTRHCVCVCVVHVHVCMCVCMRVCVCLCMCVLYHLQRPQSMSPGTIGWQRQREELLEASCQHVTAQHTKTKRRRKKKWVHDVCVCVCVCACMCACACCGPDCLDKTHVFFGRHEWRKCPTRSRRSTRRLVTWRSSPAAAAHVLRHGRNAGIHT